MEPGEEADEKIVAGWRATGAEADEAARRLAR